MTKEQLALSSALSAWRLLVARRYTVSEAALWAKHQEFIVYGAPQ